ncbi:MAG: spondin domain-containing protein [Sedimenticolaceae bacterium]
MNRSLSFLALLTSSAVLGTGFAAPVAADNDRRDAEYLVTISNLTKGQVFSPPVLATHNSSVSIFTPGSRASEELVDVAENGNGVPLADSLSRLPQVFEAIAEMQPILPLIDPDDAVAFEIHSRGRFDRFSMVSMLVNTNDAFLAIDSVELPSRRGSSRSYYAIAYDAGSESNNEECAFIPGPACAAESGNERHPEDAEEFIYVHNGVHGIADLVPKDYDWRNPVAEVVIKRVR